MTKRSGNVVADIKAAVDPQSFELTTAEGRADFDDALRREIYERSGDDENLRRHAGDLIGVWRRSVLWGDRYIESMEAFDG